MAEPTSRKTPFDQRPPHEWPPWYAPLARFKTPRLRNSLWQLANTLLPYFAIWILMIRTLQLGYPYAVTLALAVPGAAFLVRIFILFHDCVHDCLFERPGANMLAGYCLGLFTFTPYEDWKFGHLRHHASYANLDMRGFGDIWTMTLQEYRVSSRVKKTAYRLFRSPWVLLGLGALFMFLLRFRLPIRTSKRRERVSVLLTNLLILIVVLVAARTIGLRAYVLIQLPLLWLAGAAGIWLFYVQHQFEGVYWARRQDWDPLRAALEGSSFYKLPAVLSWFSGNIGYHYIHHLNSRIPNYNLKACYDAVPELQSKPPLTFRKSLSGIRLKVWDEERKELTGIS